MGRAAPGPRSAVPAGATPPSIAAAPDVEVLRRRFVGGPGQRQQVVTDPLRPREGQERQLEVGVRPACRLDDDLGEPEEPGEDRPRELDGLHPLEGHLTVLAEQHSLAQLHLTCSDPEPGEPPRHVVAEGDHGDEQQHGQQADEGVGDEGLGRVADVGRVVVDAEAGPVHAQPDVGQDPVEELGRGVPEHREEHEATAQQR